MNEIGAKPFALQFYGAAGEVTGSCHILDVGGRRILLDCGMIQGGRDAPARNREPFPFQAARIDAVVLSHAHIDHCGRLPLLVQRGFRGPIYTNGACRELLPILLEDTAQLAARDAERTNRRREPGAPEVQPLYDEDAVHAALRQVQVLPYETLRELLPGVSVRLHDAGHILGSTSVELQLAHGSTRRTLVFSGDLGQYGSPILQDPHDFAAAPEVQADAVLRESTYGDRLHRDRAATERELGEIVAQAARDGGNIVVPAFAIGRSQELLYLLGRHFQDWDLARWTIFLDSPMAIEASKVYWNHPEQFDSEARHLHASRRAMPPLPNLRLCRSADESRAINAHRARAFIIAGSGMCNGGRVLHHLKQRLGDARNHVLIAGFQAPGTLGRLLVDRVPNVRIHGDAIRVAAAVHTLGGLSAHGDQDDLVRWYGRFGGKPPVFLVHGEPVAAEGLKARLEREGTRATVTYPGLTLDLESMAVVASATVRRKPAATGASDAEPAE
jgi:metallo-beta-lactamase family protein